MIDNTQNIADNIPTLPLSDAVHVPDFPVLHLCQALNVQDRPTMSQLPTDTGAEGKQVIKTLQAAGVQFLGVIKSDPIFQKVLLPAGWKLIAAEQLMYLDLLDHKNRKRASIFYKAAAYDRRARMCLQQRYDVVREHEKEYLDNVAVAYVMDGPTVIYTVGPVPLYNQPLKPSKVGIQVENAAIRWLNTKFPQWRDRSAYWD